MRIHGDTDDSTGHPDPPAHLLQGPVPSKALGQQLPGQGQGQGKGQGQCQGSPPRALVTPRSQGTQTRHLLDDVSVLRVHLGDGPQVPEGAEDLVHLPGHSSAQVSPGTARGSG